MRRTPRSNHRLKAGLLLTTLVGAVAGLALMAATEATAFGIQSIPQARPAVGGNREPVDVFFSTGGTRVYVPEFAEGTIAEIDAATLKVTCRWTTGGERPQGVAPLPNGDV